MSPRGGEVARAVAGIAVWSGALIAPLALGSVHPELVIAHSLISGLGLLALLVFFARSGRQIELPRFGWLLLVASAWTALQLVPLPMGLLARLAPRSAELLGISLAEVGTVAWHPISLDPRATLLSLLQLGAVTALYLTAHNRMRRSERVAPLATALVVLGLVLVLVGLAGAVVAPGRALLFYRAQQGHITALITTSFVNANHGAAFLGICALLALGLAFRARDSRWRLAAGAAAVFLAIGVFLTLSRGGVVALGAGAGLFFVVRRLDERRSELGRSSFWLWVPAALIVVMAVVGWLALDPLLGELRSSLPGYGGGIGKAALWAPGMRMLEANLLLGVGRGAFATTFPRYLEPEVFTGLTFTHLENQYLHLPIEWGVPLAALVIGVSGLLWLRWLWSARHNALVSAAVAALGLLALQAVVDFNLELLGIAMPAAVLAAIASAHRGQHSRTEGSKLRMALLAGYGVALIASALVVLTLRDQLPDRVDRKLGALMAAKEAMTPTRLTELKAAITRRPADYLPHLVGGRMLARSGERRAIRWLNRAAYLAAGNGAVHFETAHVLFAFQYRKQALLECRLGLERVGRSGGAHLLRWVIDRLQGREEAVLALPLRPELATTYLKALLRLGLGDYGLAVARDARLHWPQQVEFAYLELEALLRLEAAEPAEQLATRLVERHGSERAYLLAAQAAALRHGAARAVEVLRSGVNRHPASVELGFACGNALVDAKEPKEAEQVLRTACQRAANRQDLARCHRLLARALGAQGRAHRAQIELEQARQLSQ